MEDKDIYTHKILSLLHDSLKLGGPGRLPKDELIRRFKGYPIEGELETLIKVGYIKENSQKFAARSYSYIEITGQGIEFLEGRLQLQQIIVHGDYYTVSMGDNNSHVVIGRNNSQVELQFGSDAELGEAFASVKDQMQSELVSQKNLERVLYLLDKLQDELGKESINIELIEHIKCDLLQQSDEVRAAILVLFNTKPIIKKLKRPDL